MSTETLTPKQRKRALKKENRALRPAKVAEPERGPIPDPWGSGKVVPVKPHFQRPITECLHVLAVHYLEREEHNRLALYTTFAYCYATGTHTEHAGNGRSWS